MRRANRTTSRPQWAKKLTRSQWNALKNCQGKTPTLRGLRADLAHQRAHGVVCWACRDAEAALA